MNELWYCIITAQHLIRNDYWKTIYISSVYIYWNHEI